MPHDTEIEIRDVLLNDSQSTLRQVSSVLSDLVVTDHGDSNLAAMVSEIESRPAGLAELVKAVVATYSEIMGVVESLRKSRGLLEEASMQRIKRTGLKLAEVSSATETAATGMLDGLDRALDMVDQLDASAADGAGGDGPAGLRADLRDELYQLIGLLQFQDITSQQLGYASTVLSDVEERMLRLSAVFFPDGIAPPELTPSPSEAVDPGLDPVNTADTCDPEASTLNSETRQALADEIFTVPGSA